MYLALDPMLHLLVARVEDPTSLSQRKLVLADKQENRCTCIKRYGGKTTAPSGVPEIVNPPESLRELPTSVTLRAKVIRRVSHPLRSSLRGLLPTGLRCGRPIHLSALAGSRSRSCKTPVHATARRRTRRNHPPAARKRVSRHRR